MPHAAVVQASVAHCSHRRCGRRVSGDVPPQVVEVGRAEARRPHRECGAEQRAGRKVSAGQGVRIAERGAQQLRTWCRVGVRREESQRTTTSSRVSVFRTD
eukprot:scaffold31853_cov71-Phaeocystis_antarctica.AAC.5